MINKLQRLKKPLLLGGLFLAGVLLYGLSYWQGRLLKDQQAVERWVSDDTRYTQVSVFLGDSQAFSENDVNSFRVNLSKKLEEASQKAKTADARLWLDAYSMETAGNAALGKVSEEIVVTAVKGDFFQFHPIELVSGYYFRSEELMKDRVLMDETLAWKLFGSSDVVGMGFNLNGRKCLVAGVVKDAEEKLNKRAYGSKSRIYAPLGFIGEEDSKITCYEVLVPNPVRGFGKKIVTDYFFGEVQAGEEEAAKERARTQDIEIVENSTRFQPLSLLKLVRDFGIRSMRENQVRYPYWENIARVREEYSAVSFLAAMLLFLLPLWYTLKWLYYKWRHRKWKKERLFEWIEAKREASWEKRRKIENEKINGKRMTALALVTAMAVTFLTGCGGSGGGQQASTVEFDKNLVYKATYYNKPGEIEYLNNVFSGEDGKLYAQGWNQKEERDIIVQINPDTGEAEKTFYDDGASMENSWVTGFTVDKEGNFWKTIGTYVPNEEKPELGKNIFSVKKVSPEGELLASVDLKIEDDSFFPNNLVLDNEENLYLAGSNSLLIYDREGTQIADCPIPTYLESMVKNTDGTIYVIYSTEDYKERIINKVDIAAKQLVEVRRADTGTPMDLISGKDGIYLNDNINLYTYNIETDEKTKILNWINSDINGGNTYRMCGLPDGRFACSVYDDLTQQNQLMIAEKVPPEEVKDKKLVSLAMPYNDYTVNIAVIAFNKQSDEYRIVVDNYGEYATAENYNAGLEKMNADLIAGKVPDLISVGGMQTNKYINKGLFADLYEKMDADSDFNRSDYMENIFKAFEKDGKLYTLAPRFSVQTVIAKEDNVGKTMGWTMDDLEKLLAGKPEGTKSFNGETQNSILNRGFFLGIDQYINYTEATCSFDNGEFIKLLNFAKQFPENYEIDGMMREGYYEMDSMMREGYAVAEEEANPFATDKVLLQTYYLYNYDQIHSEKYYNFGGKDLTFIGFPTANKQGSAINANMEMAVSSRAAYPDGAWAFIKFLLSDEYQSVNSFEWPVKKSAYPAIREREQKPDTYTDENGKEQIYENTAWIDGKEIKIGKVTDEEIKKVDELLNSVTQVMRYDEKVWEIIDEESSAFFSGQKPAEEVAKLIQNRVQTYLSESN